jgi:hypothetical protein
MLNLRVSLVLLTLWLAGLYNVERVYEPINLASFLYVLVGTMTVVIICIPKLRKVTLAQITFASLPLYAVLKWSLGDAFFGPQLPMTVTECLVLGLTNVLAWRVAHGLDEFVRSAGELAAISLGRQPFDCKDGESEMYREMQRARRFEHALSLATVSVSRDFKESDLQRLAQKARHEMVRKYLESRVAGVLLDATSASDLVVLRNDGFVLMFPETEGKSVRSLLEQAAKSIHEDLGLRLQVGVAEFPSEECTLAGLIDRAESQMCWLGGDAAQDTVEMALVSEETSTDFAHVV